MAMIKCPECGASISDQAVSCPHCGYPLNQTANEVSTTVSSSAQQAWDVVLVDYAGSEFNACSSLENALNLTPSDATSSLKSLPAYLYNDIPEENAIETAKLLASYNMRIAVYDPAGNVRYFQPDGYTINDTPVRPTERILPIFIPIFSRPRPHYVPPMRTPGFGPGPGMGMPRGGGRNMGGGRMGGPGNGGRGRGGMGGPGGGHGPR